MSKIAIINDAAPEQTNGVVRSNQEIIRRLRSAGHTVLVITFDPTRCHFNMPGYPEIRLQPFQGDRVRHALDTFKPDYIHIATEGPIGLAARRYCVKRNYAFTSAFHTRYGDYVRSRAEHFAKSFRLPVALSSGIRDWFGKIADYYLFWFHKPSRSIMVATDHLRKELSRKGYSNLNIWSRGVDIEQFKPYTCAFAAYAGLARPIHVVHGRVAIEKSLDVFLALDLPGSKVVIGDGPELPNLRERFTNVLYMGLLKGETLAQAISAADIFVMPSKTETFGLVLLEALACGKPIAAYDLPINCEILAVIGPRFSCLDADLAGAVRQTKVLLDSGTFNPLDARKQVAAHYSWDRSAEQFLANLKRNTENNYGVL